MGFLEHQVVQALEACGNKNSDALYLSYVFYDIYYKFFLFFQERKALYLNYQISFKHMKLILRWKIWVKNTFQNL